MKITDFHTELPTTYHSYFLYFQSLQSLFPSNHQIIQSSKHPIGPGGMRVAFESAALRQELQGVLNIIWKPAGNLPGS